MSLCELCAQLEIVLRVLEIQALHLSVFCKLVRIRKGKKCYCVYRAFLNAFICSGSSRPSLSSSGDARLFMICLKRWKIFFDARFAHGWASMTFAVVYSSHLCEASHIYLVLVHPFPANNLVTPHQHVSSRAKASSSFSELHSVSQRHR